MSTVTTLSRTPAKVYRAHPGVPVMYPMLCNVSAFPSLSLLRPVAQASDSAASGKSTFATEQVSLDAWFVAEVLPLEPLLVSYIRRNLMPGHPAGDATDLRQDVFVRAFEGAALRRPDCARSFVMTIARNLLVDHARRAQVVAIDTWEDLSLTEIACNAPSPDQVLAGRQELCLLAQALTTLPQGCREVIELRKITGMSQREVADHLGVGENTVEKQVSKGMRLLADALMERGVDLGRTLFGKRAARRQELNRSA